MFNSKGAFYTDPESFEQKEISRLKDQVANLKKSTVLKTEEVKKVKEDSKTKENLIKSYEQFLGGLQTAVNTLMKDINEETLLGGALRAVEEFHEASDGPTLDPESKTCLPDKKQRALRKRLLREEYGEYCEAEDADDIVAIADALGDMIYIILGTALAYNIPLDLVFDEIQKSNMTKVVDGKVKKRDDGKILKPDTYQAPDVEGVLFE